MTSLAHPPDRTTQDLRSHLLDADSIEAYRSGVAAGVERVARRIAGAPGPVSGIGPPSWRRWSPGSTSTRHWPTPRPPSTRRHRGEPFAAVDPGALPPQRADQRCLVVVALTPDLILGINSALTQVEYDTLSAIAPTVAQPTEFADYGAPWQTIGVALGRPEQAAALVTEIEQQFTAVRDANPQFAGRTGLLAALLEDGTYYIYAEGPAPRFLVDLGFSLPEPAAALFTGESRPPVLLSPEQLGLIDADVVLLGVYGDTAAAGQADDPVYQALPAVAAGRVVSMPELSGANGAITFGSPLSLPDALEILPPLMAAAVDGDPATPVPAVA